MGSWEGPYDFVSYKDGKGCQKQNEGNKTCIIKKFGQELLGEGKKRYVDLPFNILMNQSMKT
jgi:hypothetical protein